MWALSLEEQGAEGNKGEEPGDAVDDKGEKNGADAQMAGGGSLCALTPIAPQESEDQDPTPKKSSIACAVLSAPPCSQYEDLRTIKSYGSMAADFENVTTRKELDEMKQTLLFSRKR